MKARAARSEHTPAQRESSFHKGLRVLDVFTVDAPMWTIEEIAAALGYPASSVYRYVRELCAAGLLAGVGGAKYVVGPRIIELDHQILRCDPVHQAGRDLAAGLLRQAPAGTVMICGLRGDSVLSVFALKATGAPDLGVERGRPMPLFSGAPAKAILAHLPTRRLARLYEEHRRAIVEAGLGETQKAFARTVALLRRQPFIVSRGEFDARFLAMSVPLFDGERRVVASLSLILPIEASDEEGIERLSVPLRATGEEINERLSSLVALSAFGRGGPG